MLKAAITSPASGVYGVTFETTLYGKPDPFRPSFYLPCGSYEHAARVAKAYNGVAFTEVRPPIKNDPAELSRQVEATTPGKSLADTIAALRIGDDARHKARARPELNHHGEPVACGHSRKPGELPPHVTPAHDDVVYSARYRGAPMGIADFTAPDVTPQDRLHFGIARIALDEGGYAPDGVYWGLPRNTLWHALATEHGATMAARWFRAASYAHAVSHVREEFPKATTQRVAAAMATTSRSV